jgi:hypothetical protein
MRVGDYILYNDCIGVIIQYSLSKILPKESSIIVSKLITGIKKDVIVTDYAYRYNTDLGIIPNELKKEIILWKLKQ